MAADVRQRVAGLVSLTDRTGEVLRDVRLDDATFANVSLRGARFRGVDLAGARFFGAELVDVTISGEVQRPTVNGVDAVTSGVWGRTAARHRAVAASGLLPAMSTHLPRVLTIGRRTFTYVT